MKKLEILDLRNNHLTSLPQSLWKLSSLKILNHRNNNLGLGSLPDSLKEMHALQFLSLEGNSELGKKSIELGGYSEHPRNKNMIKNFLETV